MRRSSNPSTSWAATMIEGSLLGHHVVLKSLFATVFSEPRIMTPSRSASTAPLATGLRARLPCDFVDLRVAMNQPPPLHCNLPRKACARTQFAIATATIRALEHDFQLPIARRPFAAEKWEGKRSRRFG